MKQRRYNRVWL